MKGRYATRSRSASKASVSKESPQRDASSSEVTATRKRGQSAAKSEDAPNKKARSASNSLSLDDRDKASQSEAKAAISIDKSSWQGFCDIESEAAYLSVMLREMGVVDVTVKEVFDVDVGYLMTGLPQPLYGILLCYRYREFDNDKQGEECPNNVWFANQLPAQNSCATLGLINILMNTTDVDLGDNLGEFKKFTLDMTPQLRGEALASFTFVKEIHNSFAKKMDIQEADLALSKKARKNHKTRRGSHDSNSSVDSVEENAHHYIAFLPVDDEVWKLDGLDRNPAQIDDSDGQQDISWLSVASDRIQDLMAVAGDNDYSILALCRAPAVSLREEICGSAKATRVVETRLNVISQDWKAFATDGEIPMTPKLMETLGIKDSQLEEAPLSKTFLEEVAAMDAQTLISRRGGMIAKQMALVDNIINEISEEQTEDEKAAERRWDYGPAIKLWLEKLAANGKLDENLKESKKGAK